MFETVYISANLQITEADPKPTQMSVTQITNVYEIDPAIDPGQTPMSSASISTIYHVGDPVPGEYGATLIALAAIING